MAISFSTTPRKAYYLYTKGVIYKITTTPPTQDMLVAPPTTGAQAPGDVWSCYFRAVPYYSAEDQLCPLYIRKTKVDSTGKPVLDEDNNEQYIYTQVTLSTPYVGQSLYYSYKKEVQETVQGKQVTTTKTFYSDSPITVNGTSTYCDSIGNKYAWPKDHEQLPSQVVTENGESVRYYFDTLITEGDACTGTEFEAMDRKIGAITITSFAQKISQQVLSGISLANYATAVNSIPPYIQQYAFSGQDLAPFGPVYMKKLIEFLAEQAQTQISKTQASLTNYSNKGNCTIEYPPNYNLTNLSLSFKNIAKAQKTSSSSDSSSNTPSGGSQNQPSGE